VPIKTTVSATILEEALNGSVTVRPLQLGQPLYRKVNYYFISFLAFASTVLNLSKFKFGNITQVEKQCAHFYSVEITEQEAQKGFVCRVRSSDKSKFKVVLQSSDYIFIRLICDISAIILFGNADTGKGQNEPRPQFIEI